MEKQSPIPTIKPSTSFDRVYALAINFLILAFLLLLLEFFFWTLIQMRTNEGDKLNIVERDVYQPDEKMGHVFIPNSKGRGTLYVNGEVAFDVTYETDELARRISPVDNAEGRDKFIAFFGCSFTFGYGVEGDEVFGAQFAKRNPQYMPYNYGVPGYAPQHFWLLLNERNLRDEITESQGVGVYTFFYSHVGRVIGSMPYYNEWLSIFPYVYEENDTLHYGGNFKDGRPFTSWLYDMAWGTDALRYFNINFPLRRTPEQYDLVVKIIAESEKLFKKQFPESEFYTIILTDTPDDLEVQRRLESVGINIINLSKIYKSMEEAGETHSLPDGHPTALMHRRIAEELSLELQRAEQR